jgi:hypothetical protein
MRERHAYTAACVLMHSLGVCILAAAKGKATSTSVALCCGCQSHGLPLWFEKLPQLSSQL